MNKEGSEEGNFALYEDTWEDARGKRGIWIHHGIDETKATEDKAICFEQDAKEKVREKAKGEQMSWLRNIRRCLGGCE